MSFLFSILSNSANACVDSSIIETSQLGAMSFDDEIYIKKFFETLRTNGRLTQTEIHNLLVGTFINYNKLGGDGRLECLFPGCNAVGVERSHLFSKGFLNYHSEGGKLYGKSFYPYINRLDKGFSIEELGISEAMTFPGFCSKCEQKFLFEKLKNLGNGNDYFLQLFRTVCYEKRILEKEISRNKEVIEQIRDATAKKLKPIFDGKIKSVQGLNDIEVFILYLNGKLLNKLKAIDKTYNLFGQAYNGNKGMKIINIQLKRRLPVFAGYVGKMSFKINKKRFKSNLILNIHPVNQNETEVFFIDLNEKLSEEQFIAFDMSDLMEIFREVMICSNNLIISKSYWEMLNEETKNEILRNKSTPLLPLVSRPTVLNTV